MIRKLILFGFIVASCVPAGIKAAAEPIHPKAKRPYVLIISSQFPNINLPYLVESIVGTNVDVITNTPESPNLTPADIAGAECVLFDINASCTDQYDQYWGSLTPKSFESIFIRYWDPSSGEDFGLMRGFVHNPHRAIVINDQGHFGFYVKPIVASYFGDNIFTIMNDTTPATFYSWMERIASNISPTSAKSQSIVKPLPSKKAKPDHTVVHQPVAHYAQQPIHQVDSRVEQRAAERRQQEIERFEAQKRQKAERIQQEIERFEAQQRQAAERIQQEVQRFEAQQRQKAGRLQPAEAHIGTQQQQDAKETLNAVFLSLTDSDIAAQLIAYINQENSALIDHMIALLKLKYNKSTDGQHIAYIITKLSQTMNDHPATYVNVMNQFCNFQKK